MDWFKLDIELPKSLLDQLMGLISSSDESMYYRHNSTLSKEYTNLQFLFSKELGLVVSPLLSRFLIKPNRISVVKVDSHRVVDWHSDDARFGRTSVVIFPLSPRGKLYRRCEVRGQGFVPWMDCYVFNTLSNHRVVNNRYVRYSLQLFFNQSIVQLYSLHKKGVFIK